MIDALLQSLFNNHLFAGLLYLFLFMLLVQLVYFWAFFSQLAFRKSGVENPEKPPVSVILVASNHYNDLRKHLPEILSQDYPNYEVVVVNDASEDGSDELLERFAEQYPHLKVVVMHQSLNWFKGTKFPLSIGIKSAKNEIILVTETNFVPLSNKWLSEMMKCRKDKTEIIVAHSTFATGSKINAWYRFAGFYRQLLNFSAILTKLTFTGSASNLIFTRSLFYDNQGFTSHYTKSTGTGEMFVNQAATRSNVSLQISSESRMAFAKNLAFGKWLEKENDNFEIHRYLKFSHRAFNSLFFNSLLLFFLAFAALMILNLHWEIILGLFALRFISQLLVFGFAQKKLSEKGLLLFTPLFEIFLHLVHFFLRFRLLFDRKKIWN